MNPQQKEQKALMENFKQSINQWITEVPNLTTPHYNEGDDLMNPEAYDQIRELILNDLLPLGGRPQFHEYPFYENWQIDKNLNNLIAFTQQHVDMCNGCIGKTQQEQARRQQLFNSRGINSQTARFASVCCELRNIIEKNLPFTVFYLISNSQCNFRCPYTHSVYKNGKRSFDMDERHVMRPEEKHLFGIIINQDSKIKQLEERLERMEAWNRQNIQDKQIETKKMSEMFASLDSRIETINGTNESVKTLSSLVQKDKKELLGQISNVKKQLLDIDRKIHEINNHKQNNVPVDDLIDLTPSNNPFDEFH